MPTLRQKYVNLYWAWKAMKQRTLNPKCRAYKNYGGRGIGICDDWLRFEPFCEWSLSNGWGKGLDLDRIDNDGDYSPDNCRWVTRRENVNNRRKTVLLTVDGTTKPLTEWAEDIGCDRGLLTMWVKTHGNEYASERVSDALKHGYTRRDYGYGHRRTVRHVESGREFQSVRKAAEFFGYAPCTISNSIIQGYPTRKGTFEYV